MSVTWLANILTRMMRICYIVGQRFGIEGNKRAPNINCDKSQIGLGWFFKTVYQATGQFRDRKGAWLSQDSRKLKKKTKKTKHMSTREKEFLPWIGFCNREGWLGKSES